MNDVPRLVATDIDGTLLGDDHTISARTNEMLARVSAAGIPVVLVTGRPIRWLPLVYDQLRTPLPAICANGAVVYDPLTDSVVRADALAPELLAEVASRLREAVPGVSFAVEVTEGRHLRHEAEYPIRWDADHEAVRAVTRPEELFAVPAVKLLARSDLHAPDAFVDLVAKAIEGLAEATHSSNSGLVEISAAGVTKAAGLAWYCEQRGVAPAGVLAFGDMPNDIPMLSWAGHAVAMANAHPAVLAIADEVTAANHADGVAAYLERCLPAG